MNSQLMLYLIKNTITYIKRCSECASVVWWRPGLKYCFEEIFRAAIRPSSSKLPLWLQNWCGVTKESWCGEDYPPLHCQTTQSINGYNGQLCVEARSTIYLILTCKRKNLLNFKIITRLSRHEHTKIPYNLLLEISWIERAQNLNKHWKHLVLICTVKYYA